MNLLRKISPVMFFAIVWAIGFTIALLFNAGLALAMVCGAMLYLIAKAGEAAGAVAFGLPTLPTITIITSSECCYGISAMADFEDGTWTFQMQGDWRVMPGRYLIVPVPDEKPPTTNNQGEKHDQ